MIALLPYVRPIVLLVGSNVFMTTAWYWHLRYKEVPLFYVILISWGVAFVEYCLAVPANRYGNAVYDPAQLKTIQEVITFVVFAGFSYVYLREPLTLSQGFGFALIAAGAFFVFHKW
jgi:Uncharacterized protein conserved in bacteria